MLVLIGCKPQVQNEIYGLYRAGYDIAEEKLELYKNGAFKQEIKIKDPLKTIVEEGTWEYSTMTGNITFHGKFMVVINGVGEYNPDFDNPEDGLVVLPVKEILGTVTLGSAEGIVYKKVTNK